MLKARHFVRHGGKTFPPGEELPAMSAEREDRLIRMNAAERVGQAAQERRTEDEQDPRKLTLFQFDGQQVTFVKETAKRIYYLNPDGVEVHTPKEEWAKEAEAVNPLVEVSGTLELPEGVDPKLLPGS